MDRKHVIKMSQELGQDLQVSTRGAEWRHFPGQPQIYGNTVLRSRVEGSKAWERQAGSKDGQRQMAQKIGPY